MTAVQAILLAVSVITFGYLAIAMFKPEGKQHVADPCVRVWTRVADGLHWLLRQRMPRV